MGYTKANRERVPKAVCKGESRAAVVPSPEKLKERRKSKMRNGTDKKVKRPFKSAKDSRTGG